MSARPLENRPDLVTYVDGEPMISAKGMAYLCGVTEDEIHAEAKRQNAGRFGQFKMPQAWLRQGKEIAARLGTDNMAYALYLLAAEREG
jgi:hypothetical protein